MEKTAIDQANEMRKKALEEAMKNQDGESINEVVNISITPKK
jgi:hypothetical protein